jgi:two-component system, sensor histidine kinase and response regulator
MEPKEKQQCSILIIDDNKENLKVVSNFLKAEGYQIALSLNARDGLQILEENDIHLILLDIMMPEVDGYTFCRQIKSISHLKDTPVIFLTAKTETSDLVEGFKAGGVDYITKPFHKAELIARVETHLALSRAKNKILAQAEQIKKINRTKDRLYSVIAHDIKSPFANISMLISTIAEGYLKPGTEEFTEILQSINNSTKETYALLENLLQWTRSQTGDLDLAPENIQLSDLITNVIRFLLPNAKKKNIDLGQELEEGLFVFADKMTMQSVLQNLLTNAIKFTPEAGNVTVKGKTEGNQVVISVQDNGIGMNAEQLDKLFVDGQHFTTHGTNNEKGSGLGLLLVKEFINRNKGEISVTSEAGNGTTFIIRLPATS